MSARAVRPDDSRMASVRKVPATVASRRARILDALGTQSISSQEQLRDFLAGEGIAVSQGTLSRDLVALGAVRQVLPDGQVRYGLRTGRAVASLPRPDGLARVATDVLVSAEAAGNIAVLRTPPGAAHYLADSLDRSDAGDVVGHIVGTVAGDDTVLVVLRTQREARQLCEMLGDLAARGRITGGQDPGRRQVASHDGA